jgi:hypothetical protein
MYVVMVERSLDEVDCLLLSMWCADKSDVAGSFSTAIYVSEQNFKFQNRSVEGQAKMTKNLF